MQREKKKDKRCKDRSLEYECMHGGQTTGSHRSASSLKIGQSQVVDKTVKVSRATWNALCLNGEGALRQCRLWVWVRMRVRVRVRVTLVDVTRRHGP